MSRSNWTRGFLWLSVISWAIGLGAKLFDLLVLAGAWGGAPPASLAFYPYGPHWPIDPGNFFQPLSGLILIGSVGSLICGWKTGSSYRFWLWLPVIAFGLIWIATPIEFWPMITQLYRVAHGKVAMSDLELAKLVRHWLIDDWIRTGVIAVGFVSSVNAISKPYASQAKELLRS